MFESVLRKSKYRRRSLRLERMEDRRLLTTVDLASLMQVEGTSLYGADAGDVSGWVWGDAGDVNGDGYSDFSIGSQVAAGSSNDRPYAGEVHVVFGGPTLPETIDLANLGSAGMTIYGAEDQARHFLADSAGDLNGDGFDDLIVSAFSNGFSSFVIFGGASLPQTIDLATPGAADMTILPADAGERIPGRSAGDVNGDGFDDLILGAGAANGVNNLKPLSGESYVIFGSASPPATIDLANLGSSGLILYGANADDQAGRRVRAAEDVNADGFDDFLIDAIGKGYLVYGNPTLPQSAAIDLGNLGNAGVTILGNYAQDAAGDVNGDGYADVIFEGNASTYLMYGGPSLPSNIDETDLVTSGVQIVGGDIFEVSGAGDVNGDGYEDLLISERSAVGQSHLVFGGPNLASTIDLANLGNGGITFREIDPLDDLVRVGGAGDVNGDGFDDFLFGAQLADGLNNSRIDSGETYLIYGGGDLWNVNSQDIFMDSFEVAEWNNVWVGDGQNAWFLSNQRATDQSWSAEVDGGATDATLELANSLDLSWTASATLAFDWFIEGSFDSGEYVALDISTDGGANWTHDVRRIDGNQSQEDVWHGELVDMKPFLSSQDVKIRFRAMVSSSNEDANVDNIRIVGVPLGPNQSPVANAGGPYAGDEGSPIQLDGSSSSDPDGSIASYAWDFDGDGFYDDATGAQPSYTQIDSGVHVVGLQVTDNRGATNTTTAAVTVANVAPMADAGPDLTGSVNSPVNLSASASSDPGNDIVTYAWDLDNDGQYDDATGVAATFSSGSVGIFFVGLQVIDADGAMSTDSISITLTDAPATPAIYVGDIHDVFETRQRGKRIDYQLVIDVRQDDGNGIADFGDTGIAGVYVVVDLFDANDNLVVTLSGITDTAGVFRSDWIRDLAPGDYRADVVDLVLSGFSWNPFMDLEDEEFLTVL